MDRAPRHKDRRQLSRRSVLAALSLGGPLLSSGCTKPAYGYSYRLTLSIDANGATHTGSSVVHVRRWMQQTIDQGWTMPTSINGEATAVELGDGRAVVALLTTDRTTTLWGGSPTGVLLKDYGLPDAWPPRPEDIRALSDARGPVELPADQMPELIGFKRSDDPRSAVLLDPSDLSALGADVRLRSAQIEVTDSSVSSGIVRVFPWLKAKLEAERQTRQYTVSLTSHPDWMLELPTVHPPLLFVFPSQFKRTDW
jgi:hypothetical protein